VCAGTYYLRRYLEKRKEQRHRARLHQIWDLQVKRQEMRKEVEELQREYYQLHPTDEPEESMVHRAVRLEKERVQLRVARISAEIMERIESDEEDEEELK
jgi:hypothetical protein